MILKVDGTAIPTTKLVLRESISEQVSTVVVEAPVAIVGDATLEHMGQSLELYPWSVSLQSENRVITTLVPKSYQEALQKVVEPITGDFKLAQVLDTAGVSYLIPKADNAQYWEVPKLKMERFIDFVMKRVAYKAPLWTYSVFGGLYLFDISELLNGKGAPMTAKVYEDKISLDWFGRIPQNINLEITTLEESEQIQVQAFENQGTGNDFRLITVDKLKYLPEQILRSQQGRKYYTSHQIKAAGTISPPVLGAIYDFNKQKYCCIQYELQENGVSLVLAGPGTQ